MFKGNFDGAGHRFAIVCSRFNKPIVDRLLDGALECLQMHDVAQENIAIAWVPGAFEIPLTAKRFAESGKVEAVICLGCVIRGETAHFDHVAGQAAAGIMQATLSTRIPLIFGVLTTENQAQAEARSGIKGGNLGYEYARSAIEMVTLFEQMSSEELCV